MNACLKKSFGLTMRLPELSRLLFQSDLCSRFHYTSVDLATAGAIEIRRDCYFRNTNQDTAHQIN